MEIKSFYILSAVLVATLHINSVQSVDYESAKKERVACFEPPTVKTDLAWFMTVKKWYYVAMNRLDLYTISLDLTGKSPKDLHEDEVYYDSCISWTGNVEDMTFDVVGYHGRKRTFKMEPLDDHFGKMRFQLSDGGLPGVGYTVLTDNKTFSLSVTCFDDLKQMVWTVASPYKSLPKSTMKLIHDHVKSMGFKDEYFTSQRYDHCKDDDDNEIDGSDGKSEL